MEKYRLYNETKEQYETVISEGEPTVCPSDPADTIKEGSITVQELDVKTNPNNIATELNLANYKQLKFNAIDEKSGDLILSGGFNYGGIDFSLRLTSQINLLGVEIKRNDPILPITFNSVDNTQEIVLSTAADVDNFFMSALGQKKAFLDSGTALKDEVRAATDKTEVDAVIDNR
jgi:hypothetical protein